MIISFKIENFKSFRKASLLDFRRKSKEKKGAGFVAKKSGEDLLKVLALVGVNGSGKTSLFQGLGFMASMVLQSHSHTADKDITYMPFGSSKKPVKLEVDFTHQNKRYLYGFSSTNERVEEEFAYAYETAKPKKIFKRIRQKFEFGREYEKDLKEKSGYVIDKTLMVSRAVQLNSETLRPIFGFFSKIYVANSFFRSPDFGLLKKGKFKKDLLEKLYHADFSIGDLELVKRKIKNIKMSINNVPSPKKSEELSVQQEIIDQEIDELILLHKNYGKTLKIDFNSESEGTKKFVSLFYNLLTIPEGAVILYDEIGNSLNTEIVKFIVNHFAKRKNTHQLVLTTHQPDVLNHLRSDQTKIVDKENSESKILELHDIVKSNEKINRNYGDYYREGVLGGFPSVYDEHED